MIKNFFDLYYIKLYFTLKQQIPSALGVEKSASAFITSLLLFFNFVVIYYIISFIIFHFILSTTNWHLLITYFIVAISYFTIIIFGFFYFKKHHQILHSNYINQKNSINFSGFVYLIYSLTVLGILILSTYYFFGYYI